MELTKDTGEPFTADDAIHEAYAWIRTGESSFGDGGLAVRACAAAMASAYVALADHLRPLEAAARVTAIDGGD